MSFRLPPGGTDASGEKPQGLLRRIPPPSGAQISLSRPPAPWPYPFCRHRRCISQAAQPPGPGSTLWWTGGNRIGSTGAGGSQHHPRDPAQADIASRPALPPKFRANPPGPKKSRNTVQGPERPHPHTTLITFSPFRSAFFSLAAEKARPVWFLCPGGIMAT